MKYKVFPRYQTTSIVSQSLAYKYIIKNGIIDQKIDDLIYYIIIREYNIVECTVFTFSGMIYDYYSAVIFYNEEKYFNNYINYYV